jgi:hypothetical protein
VCSRGGPVPLFIGCVRTRTFFCLISPVWPQEVGKFVATYTRVPQYRETFQENFINGKRLLKLKHTQLPQLGVQRYEHIKELWQRIQNIQKVANEYEAMLADPDKLMEYGAVRIQSLARGRLDRHRVQVCCRSDAPVCWPISLQVYLL